MVWARFQNYDSRSISIRLVLSKCLKKENEALYVQFCNYSSDERINSAKCDWTREQRCRSHPTNIPAAAARLTLERDLMKNEMNDSTVVDLVGCRVDATSLVLSITFLRTKVAKK